MQSSSALPVPFVCYCPPSVCGSFPQILLQNRKKLQHHCHSLFQKIHLLHYRLFTAQRSHICPRYLQRSCMEIYVFLRHSRGMYSPIRFSHTVVRFLCSVKSEVCLSLTVIFLYYFSVSASYAWTNMSSILRRASGSCLW